MTSDSDGYMPYKTNILSSPIESVGFHRQAGDAPKSQIALQKSGSIFMLQGSSLLKALL